MFNPPITLNPDPKDVETNKVITLLSYIIFFIPMLAAKDSPFAMYHANQGLTLFLTAVAVNIILSIIPILGWILLPFANLAILVFVILGILNVVNGKAKPLPLIGEYTLLK